MNLWKSMSSNKFSFLSVQTFINFFIVNGAINHNILCTGWMIKQLAKISKIQLPMPVFIPFY